MRPNSRGLSKFRRLTRYLAGDFLCVGTAAAEAPPRFDLPVICEMGRVCYIQNHFDTDTGRWPAGRYRGSYRLLRPDDGELRELTTVTRHLIVE